MCAIYICFIVLFSVRIKFFNHFLNFLRYNVVLLGLYMYGLKDWNMFELLNFSLFKLCSIEKLYIYIYIYIFFAIILTSISLPALRQQFSLSSLQLLTHPDRRKTCRFALAIKDVNSKYFSCCLPICTHNIAFTLNIQSILNKQSCLFSIQFKTTVIV